MAEGDELSFQELPIVGAFMVTAARHVDDRGWFARSWSAPEFAQHGLDPRMSQSSFSFNARSGTLRGVHYQAAPHAECKLVTCVRGTIWDVLVDLRTDSPSYRRWHGEALDGDVPRAIYVPEGVAHGFLSQSDNALILYQISVPYQRSAARGIRWDDPAFGIAWPSPPRVIGERDRAYPDFGAVDEAG
jgi:dTDP-4-dehydrorhamnose 3,5-epimerase